jgi:GrpB-like predicted nucleotidyltransferase (UPF0157 family)
VVEYRTVVIVEHDPAWSSTFAELRAIYIAAVGDVALACEHVGSTSVPGLAAKAVLDIDIVIESMDRFPAVVAALAPLGYSHRGDLGVRDREAFGREDEQVPRDGSGRRWMSHHLYVCPGDGAELPRHLGFRDYLRGHPEEAMRYAALKRELAARHPNDIDAYCEGKSEFVEGILLKAGVTRAAP